MSVDDERSPIMTDHTPSYNTAAPPDTVFSVDDALLQVGMGPYQYKRFPIIACMGFAQSTVLTLPFMLMAALTCQFHLSHVDQALTISVLFLGNMTGDLLAGVICDRAGRKPVLLLGGWALFFATCSLSFVHLYFLLLWGMFGLGFGIGLSTFTAIIMVSELATPESRSKSITLISVFWGGGALFTATVSFLLLNMVGWRAVVVACCVPLFIIALLICFMPETPKYLAASGNLDGARCVLKTMAKENGRALPRGALTAQPVDRRGEIADMFGAEYRTVSILLMTVYFFSGFIFYSGYAFLPFLLQDGYCGLPHLSTPPPCTFSSTTLGETMFVTAAEIVLLPFTALLSEQVGRLPTMRLLSTLLVCVSPFLILCLGVVFTITALFIQRGVIQSLMNVLFIYAPETYPTHMRAVSCGVAMSMMTAGGFFSPIFVYIQLHRLYSWTILMYILTAAAGVACAVTFLLSNETRGTNLPDVAEVGSCVGSCRDPEEGGTD